MDAPSEVSTPAGRATHRPNTPTKTRGQSVLEFALTLPVFLWLVIGIVDLGRGVASYSLVSNAAREGARAGIYPETPDTGIRAAVNSETLILGAIPNSDITITPSAGSRSSGQTIAVKVVYRFQPVTPILSNAIGSTITMSATSSMVIE